MRIVNPVTCTIWSILLVIFGSSGMEDFGAMLVIAAIPWFYYWHKTSRWKKGNPYMNMMPYVNKKGFPEVKFRQLPMQLNEYKFFAIPAHRVMANRGNISMPNAGVFLVTNKRICFISETAGFGRKISDFRAANVSGKRLILNAGNDVYILNIPKDHIGFAYSFTNGAMNGLEEIYYSKAKLPAGYLKSVHNKLK